MATSDDRYEGKGTGIEHSLNEPLNSGREIGERHVQLLVTYLEQLKARNELLPMYRGKPNKLAIANHLGFNYKVWRDNPNALDVLNEAAKDETLTGIKTNLPAGNGYNKSEGITTEQSLPANESDDQRGMCERSRYLQASLDKLTKRNRELEERDVVREATIQELRRKLKEFSHIEDMMATSGRRYIP
jgi:hypothetical protein